MIISSGGLGSGGSSAPGSGAADTVQTTNGAGVLQGASNVLAGTGFISIGASPAQSGALRLANNSTVMWRNAANNDDLAGVVIDASNNYTLGNGTSATAVLQSATTNIIRHGSSTNTVVTNSSGNVALCPPTSGLGSFGGGIRCIFIGNVTTVPTTNPTGGIILYSDAGVLKWRDTAGTVHTLP